MLHPVTQRAGIKNTPFGNCCLESIGIRKPAYRKKRIRKLQGADEVQRFHCQ